MKKLFVVLILLLFFFNVMLLLQPVSAGRNDTIILGWNGTHYYRVALDWSTRALTTIGYPHHEIHAGSHYFVGGFDEMASGETKAFTVYVPTGAANPHMQFAVTSNKILTYYIYEEDDSATAVEIGTGSPVTAVNNERNSDNTSGVHITLNPNIYNTGALSANSEYIDSGKFGTAGAGAKQDVGGQAGHENELVLRSGTTTIYQFISGEASAFVSYRGWWYEHLAKDP